MHADDLLIGPRGRRLCFEFAATSTLRQAVVECCTWATYWQEPYVEDIDLARNPEQLRPTAEVIAASSDVSWWRDPVDVGDQWVVSGRVDMFGPLDEPRIRTHEEVVTAERAFVARLCQPDDDPDPTGERWRMTSGWWWSFPSATAYSTRSAPEDGFPLGVIWAEDAPYYDDAAAWRLQVGLRRPVYEIDTPDDWVALVRRYPLDVSSPSRRGDWWRTTGRDGDWAIPDWQAVMRDYDGAHLTVAGYLTTAGRALDVDEQFATVLAGWPPDQTYWFTDEVVVRGAAQRWVRDDEQWTRG